MTSDCNLLLLFELSGARGILCSFVAMVIDQNVTNWYDQVQSFSLIA